MIIVAPLTIDAARMESGREALVALRNRFGLQGLFDSPTAGDSASGTGIALYVTIEPRLPSTSPVTAVVVIDARSRAEKTEEGMARRPDHNADMPMPCDQVTRCRTRHSLECRHSVIDVVGTRIGIREAGALVNGIYQVGAIVLAVAQMFRIECSGDHRQSIVGIQSHFPRVADRGDYRLSDSVRA